MPPNWAGTPDGRCLDLFAKLAKGEDAGFGATVIPGEAAAETHVPPILEAGDIWVPALASLGRDDDGRSAASPGMPSFVDQVPLAVPPIRVAVSILTPGPIVEESATRLM